MSDKHGGAWRPPPPWEEDIEYPTEYRGQPLNDPQGGAGWVTSGSTAGPPDRSSQSQQSQEAASHSPYPSRKSWIEEGESSQHLQHEYFPVANDPTPAEGQETQRSKLRKKKQPSVEKLTCVSPLSTTTAEAVPSSPPAQYHPQTSPYTEQQNPYPHIDNTAGTQQQEYLTATGLDNSQLYQTNPDQSAAINQPVYPQAAHVAQKEAHVIYPNFPESDQATYYQPQMSPAASNSQTASQPAASKEILSTHYSYYPDPNAYSNAPYVQEPPQAFIPNSVQQFQQIPLTENTPSSDPRQNDTVIPLKSWRYRFDATSWRPRFTHHFREPNCVYHASSTLMRHRDAMGRLTHKPMGDRYLHAQSGDLRKLIVQCSDDVFDNNTRFGGGSGGATWRRTYVRKTSPLAARMATWVTDYKTNYGGWSDFWVQALRTIPAAFGMMFFVWSVQTTPSHDDLCYNRVHYRYYGDAKVWSNPRENTDHKAITTASAADTVYRLLRPRILCLLRTQGTGYDFIRVEDWYAANAESGKALDYLFVTYSNEQFRNASTEDMTALHEIGETAAREAGIPAFWASGSCMFDPTAPSTNTDEVEEDVYRIADIVRGCAGMVIAVAQGKKYNHPISSTSTLLRQWGSRVWTFPEVLLCPRDQFPIYTYAYDATSNRTMPSKLETLAKNQLGKIVWSDASVAQQLMDHYQGNINLSRLELAILALKCLYARQTTQFLQGDHTYALMGLLRLRPQIDRSDTAFEAFARVSLSNDSDRLLERYVCLLPKTQAQPWHCMDDQYGCSPWDIEPSSQVAGVCTDETVVLDGLYGASVRYKSFKKVWYATGPSWKRTLAQKAMEISPVFLIIAIAMFAVLGQITRPSRGYWGRSISALQASAGGLSPRYSYYSSYDDLMDAYYRSVMAPYIAVGVVFLFLWIVMVLLTPRLVKTVYGGKFHNVQACFFGVEGYLNPPTLERAIFGGSFGRLKWSTNGSPLSRSTNVSVKVLDGPHHLDGSDDIIEKVGIDPATDPSTRDKIERAKHAEPGDMRIFTLVDTYNMTVTLFEAVKPPTAIFLCGSEGGMQRAVACSYDWPTQTWRRETVLRLPTESLNRMMRVRRVKIGIVKKEWPTWGYVQPGASQPVAV